MRTGTGMAAVVFYGVLWAEGANDVIADKLQIPLYTITWIARVLIFVGPALAFVITRRVCLGLQRKDCGDAAARLESGIIRQLPDGEFIEVHQPVNEESRAVLEAKRVPALLPAPGSEDENGVPAPASRGMLGKARAVANRAFAETIVIEADGHGNGHDHEVGRRGGRRGARGGRRAEFGGPAPRGGRRGLSASSGARLVTCRSHLDARAQVAVVQEVGDQRRTPGPRRPPRARPRPPAAACG